MIMMMMIMVMMIECARIPERQTERFVGFVATSRLPQTAREKGSAREEDMIAMRLGEASRERDQTRARRPAAVARWQQHRRRRRRPWCAVQATDTTCTPSLLACKIDRSIGRDETRRGMSVRCFVRVSECTTSARSRLGVVAVPTMATTSDGPACECVRSGFVVPLVGLSIVYDHPIGRWRRES